MAHSQDVLIHSLFLHQSCWKVKSLLFRVGGPREKPLYKDVNQTQSQLTFDAGTISLNIRYLSLNMLCYSCNREPKEIAVMQVTRESKALL